MAHPTVIINNVTYQEVPEIHIPAQGGGTAMFYDASQTNVSASDVLSGKIFVGSSGEDTGTMANNGSTGGSISTKSGSVNIPAGYTSGGSVSLNASSVTDLVSGNLLAGKTVLGISGSLTLPSISQDSTTKVLTIS